MPQPDSGPNSAFKIVMISLAIIIGIIAIVFMSKKNNIDLVVKVKPEEIELGFKAKKEPSNTENKPNPKRVDVDQEIVELDTDLTGLKATNLKAEDLPDEINIKQKIGKAKAEGSITGVDITRTTVKE